MGWFAAPALRTGDPLDDPGNYGTLDIIKALKWVRDNIAAFGGDPKNITIMGQSAGAMDVFSMLASPLAKGLFHRAFSMSGPPLSSPLEAAENSANKTIYNLLIKDGYASNDQEAQQFMDAKGNAWVADYMRSKPAADLLAPVSFNMDELNPSTNISIIQDGCVIPGPVIETISSGKYTKVPTILSSTRDEMKFFLPLVIGTNSEAGFAKIASEGDINSPTFQTGDTGIPLKEFLSPLVSPFYNLLAQSVSLVMFKYWGVILTGYDMSKRQNNVYTYQFNWDEEPKPLDTVLGAAHAMDIPFMFHNFDIGDNQISRICWCEKTRKTREVFSSAMMRYLAQFARTGNPNMSGLPVWKSVTKATTNTMVFDTPFK